MAAGVVDLHMHTTASDGLCGPAELVNRAARAGIRVLSVTDHDTVAALGQVESASVHAGIAFVPGIEITAVEHGRDVHVLGYFFDRSNPSLGSLLERQRADRIERINAMADRLDMLGKPIDRADLNMTMAAAAPGRPHLARALVKAGHAIDVRQAFDLLVGDGRPAWVPRRGVPPSRVIDAILGAGGIASLAHPGLLRRDDLIAGLADAGLGALEAFHSEHDEAATSHYLDLARRHNLLVTGGSDYHGDKDRRSTAFGTVGLPSDLFERLACRAAGKA